MSPSIIFQFAVRIFTPMLLILSVIIFWRGHQLPGGGFIGGLLAATALMIHALCWGPNATIKKMRTQPQNVLFAGLLVAIISAVWAPLLGQEFFVGLWTEVPLLGGLGTPMLFDLGVYLVVIGSVCTALFALLEDEK